MIASKQQSTTIFALFPIVYLGVGMALDPLLAPFYLDASWRGSTLLNFLNWHISIFTSIELIGLCLAIPLSFILCTVLPNRLLTPPMLKVSLPINLGIAMLFFLNFGYLSSVLVLTATVMTVIHLYKASK